MSSIDDTLEWDELSWWALRLPDGIDLRPWTVEPWRNKWAAGRFPARSRPLTRFFAMFQVWQLCRGAAVIGACLPGYASRDRDGVVEQKRQQEVV